MFLRLSAIVFLVVPLLLSAADSSSLAHENKNGQFWVHGRLSAYNGTPTFRIWVVGTKRILGVSELPFVANPDYLTMPDALSNIFVTEESIFGTEIYADFLVEPLSPDKKGVMRPVKILAAKNLVVAKRDGQFIRKEYNVTQDADVVSKSSATATISRNAIFWPTEATCPGGLPQKSAKRIFKLPDGTEFEACFEITTKGNGTLTFPGLCVRVLDYHDDGVRFKNGLLRCRWMETDGAVELAVNGTAFQTDEKGDVIMESTSISATFRYDKQKRVFKVVRCPPQVHYFEKPSR